MKFEKRINADEFKNLYINKGLTIKEISNHYSVSKRTISRFIKTHNLHKQSNTYHSLNHNIFHQITPESAYWAGFIAADGNIYKDRAGFKVKLSSKDASHLYKLCNFLERDNALYNYIEVVKGKAYNTSTLMVYSPRIAKDLYNNFNITPNKTFSIQPPDIKDPIISHYIRGFMDGDGCIRDKIRLHFVSGSYDILDWIKTTLISKTNHPTNTKIRKRKDNRTYEMEFSKNIAISFLNYIYNNSTDKTRLARKYERYEIFNRRL